VIWEAEAARAAEAGAGRRVSTGRLHGLGFQLAAAPAAVACRQALAPHGSLCPPAVSQPLPHRVLCPSISCPTRRPAPCAVRQAALEQGPPASVLSGVWCGNRVQAAFQCPAKAAPTVIREKLKYHTPAGTVAARRAFAPESFPISSARCGAATWSWRLVLQGRRSAGGLLDGSCRPGHAQVPAEHLAAGPFVRFNRRAGPIARCAPACPFAWAAASPVAAASTSPSGDRAGREPRAPVFHRGALIRGY